MGPSPSADMVGSIIGVDGEEFKPRSILRKEAASATTAATARPQGGAQEEDSTYRLEIVWRNVLVFVYLHIAAVYGGYLMLTAAKWYTVAWGNIIIHSPIQCKHNKQTTLASVFDYCLR